MLPRIHQNRILLSTYLKNTCTYCTMIYGCFGKINARNYEQSLLFRYMKINRDRYKYVGM